MPASRALAAFVRRGVRTSLRLRVLAILLTALVAVQLASFAVVGATRGQAARHLSNDLVAADVRVVRARLAERDPGARERLLPDLGRGTYRWALAAPADTLPPARDGLLRELAQRVARELPGTGADAVLWQGLPALRVPVDGTHDAIAVFPEGLPSSTPAPWAAIAYVLLVTAVVACAGWWSVGLAVRPLDRAARAASAIAEDLGRPPLPQQGPREVVELARSLNALQAEVRRQLDARSAMLAAVSHDLRTPVTRLRLRVATLADSDTRRHIEDDLDAMSTLIDEGLAYARSERLEEARGPVDLDALVENVVDQAVDLGQDCRYAPGTVPAVIAAPRALTRLLQNLVDNALRYGGHAEIAVESLGHEVEITVADRGPGVADADLERMFTPFVRGDASRGRDPGGSGLGLAIARNIAQAHGGRLWLEARAGGGLVARLRLPRGSGVDAAPQAG